MVSYNVAGPEFRGCADAEFLHENKCTRERQAVTVVDNQKHVDVDVELCYCDSDLCNQERSSTVINRFSPIIVIFLLINAIY